MSRRSAGADFALPLPSENELFISSASGRHDKSVAMTVEESEGDDNVRTC